jgi:transcriptional regulator with XRE-family HTH domain
MPRKPKTKHPIRELRKIIGKSQKEFGLSIGITPSAMKKIENNDLKLSGRVARKIQIEAGVDSSALLKGRLRAFEGQEYTAGFYEYWKDMHSWQSEDIAEAIASQARILLLAAVVGSKKRMWNVIGEIIETLDRCRTDFNLERPIDAILAKQKPPIKWDDVIKPSRQWEATAPRKPRPSSRRRR